MTTDVGQSDSRSITAEPVPQPVGPVEGQAGGDSHKEALTEVPLAYSAYEGARKRLGDAFKGRTHHDRHAYKEAARRYQAYEIAMSKALRTRERAEQQALDVYRRNVERAIESAGAVYRESLLQALVTCRREIQQAWMASAENSEEMRSIFHGDEDAPQP